MGTVKHDIGTVGTGKDVMVSFGKTGCEGYVPQEHKNRAIHFKTK